MSLRLKNVVRIVNQALPAVASSIVSALDETNQTPIKVVCSYDFKSLYEAGNFDSKAILLDNWVKMERRFPKLDPKIEGNNVRRSVCALLDRHFKNNRFFMFIEVLFEGLQDLHLLVCTRLSKPVGVKCGSSLLVFGKDSFLESQSFADILGAGVDTIYFLDFTVSMEMTYLIPTQVNFETAVKGVNTLCEKLNELSEDALIESIWSDPESKKFDERCLGLLFQTTFFGMMYPSMRKTVLESFGVGYSGGRTPEEVLYFRGNWENVSEAYYRGENQYEVEGFQFYTDQELVVLKAKVPRVKVGWNDTTIITKQGRLEEAFKKGILEKRVAWEFCRAAFDAWEHAKLGFDEGEFFSGLAERVAGLDDRAEVMDFAKTAWKEALKVYH